MLVMALAGCRGTADERQASRACQAYARAFAEGAGERCGRGTYQANLEAFRSAAGVGSSCDRVFGVRDEAALTDDCLPWVSEQADCELFDDPSAYLTALPESCRAQLELGDASAEVSTP